MLTIIRRKDVCDGRSLLTKFQLDLCWYRRTPLILTLVIRITNYRDRLGPSDNFVENNAKLISLEIAGCRIKYSRVLWILELDIRRGRKVYTQVHTVNSNSRTAT